MIKMNKYRCCYFVVVLNIYMNFFICWHYLFDLFLSLSLFLKSQFLFIFVRRRRLKFKYLFKKNLNDRKFRVWSFCFCFVLCVCVELELEEKYLFLCGGAIYYIISSSISRIMKWPKTHNEFIYMKKKFFFLSSW